MCVCVGECERKRERESLTFDPGESGGAGDAESCEIVGHLLLIGLVTALHPSLVQSVVIVEDKLQDVPEEAGVEELGLEPGVHTEGRAGLDCHTVQSSQVLKGG